VTTPVFLPERNLLIKNQKAATKSWSCAKVGMDE
jgi:hypothetical protein